MKKEPQSLEELVVQVRKMVRGLDERLTRLESQIAALLRLQTITDDPGDPMVAVDRGRFAYFSQHEEDGLLHALFERIGVTNRRFVVIGCGGNGGNTGFLARECGWSGLMVDIAPRAVRLMNELFNRERVKAVELAVNGRNVQALLQQQSVPTEPDLLDLDIDGLDYWVMKALTEKYRPRVIVAEYNSVYGPAAAVTVPEAETFERRDRSPDNLYFGASLQAHVRLLESRGYRLVLVDPSGTNAFFLREDVGLEFPRIRADEAFRYYSRHSATAESLGDVAKYFRSHGLPLVDV